MDPLLPSMGGHALDRHVFDFMPDEAGVPDAGGEAAPSPDAAIHEGGATGEPESSAGATGQPQPSAPDFDPLEVQAELEYLRNQNAQVIEAFQGFAARGATQEQMQQVQQAGIDPSLLNPLDDNFGVNLLSLMQQRDQQMLGRMEQLAQAMQAPMLAQQEAAVVAEGEERLTDMLADDMARNGDLPANAQKMVRVLAENAFPQFAARYGSGPRSAEMAMAHAAREVRGLLGEVGQQAQTEQTNRMATLAGVRGEPGSGAAGVETASDAPLSPRELALKYSTRMKSAAV